MTSQLASPVQLPRCSDADRAAGDSPVGSATAFDTFLLLDYRRPWSRVAAADAVRDTLPAAAQDAVAADKSLRAFAIRPVTDRFATAAVNPRVGRVGSTPHLRSIPLSRLTPMLRAGIGREPDLASDESLLIGVCTNAKRDQCCAIRGRKVATALASEFGSCITEISHLGGHRFAATMLVLPTGYSYGFLDPAAARAVVRDALSGLIHPQNLRGRADLSPSAQAAEAYWRTQLGPAPLEAVLITAETPVAESITQVQGRVHGSDETVSVRYHPGPVVSATACGGKPFKTGRWEVRPQ